MIGSGISSLWQCVVAILCNDLVMDGIALAMRGRDVVDAVHFLAMSGRMVATQWPDMTSS